MVNGKPQSQWPTLKPVGFLAILIFALSLGMNIWLSAQHTDTIHVQARTSGGENPGARTAEAALRLCNLPVKVDDRAQMVALATAGGGAGLALFTFLGFVWVRTHWLRRYNVSLGQVRENSQQLETARVQLQNQIDEQIRLEEKLRQVNLPTSQSKPGPAQ